MYIQIYQLHGLIRAAALEVGSNEDTGGQVVYIRELADALALSPDVGRVEIVTRLIMDETYPSYSLPFEVINDKVSIVRLPCGPSRYLKKTELWPYLDEFVENASYYITSDNAIPDIVHSNYADAGYVCSKLAKELSIPHVFYAHSLGRPKLNELKTILKSTYQIEADFNFTQRINAEEKIIAEADALLIGSEDELKKQYQYYDISLKSPKFSIIPPGVNLNRYKPYEESTEKERLLIHRLSETINDKLLSPGLKPIFMLSRLEAKKNILNMVECFVDTPELYQQANLIICAGNTINQHRLTASQTALLDSINAVIAKKQMGGRVVLLDGLDYEKEIPLIYRLIAAQKGVFVNCDLTDSISLTVIEAMASGLPLVMNENKALLSMLNPINADLMINVKKHHRLSETIIKLYKDPQSWELYSSSNLGLIRDELSWDKAAERHLELYKSCIKRFS